MGGESGEERTREGARRGRTSFISSTCENGLCSSDSAVQESKGRDAGVVGRKPLLKYSQRGMEEENLVPCRQVSFSFHVIYLLQSFSKAGSVVSLFIS